LEFLDFSIAKTREKLGVMIRDKIFVTGMKSAHRLAASQGVDRNRRRSERESG